jgi:hypothetical protein
MPARRSYPPEVNPARLEDLPFVHRPGDTPKTSDIWQCSRCRNQAPCHWHFPDAATYRHACDVGYECGAHLAQYMKEQPPWSCHGILRKILADIDFKAESPNHGYSVGFIAYLERLFRFAALDLDVFADVDETQAYYKEMAGPGAFQAEKAGDL